jgi:hypothetical protein
MRDIAIIVVAQNISKAIIKRFKLCAEKSCRSLKFDIYIGDSKEELFYKTKILNSLLRKVVDRYSVVIQTDIDLVIPPGIIEKTFQRVMSHPDYAYHHVLRYVQEEDIQSNSYESYPWEKWRSVTPIFCSGGWNGMSSQTWLKSRGYNEKMYAWGYEDTEFYHRAKRLGIKWFKDDSFSLVHINHQPRQINRVEENTSIGDQYSDETDWIRNKIVTKL